jgi:hypothetical protein
MFGIIAIEKQDRSKVFMLGVQLAKRSKADPQQPTVAGTLRAMAPKWLGSEGASPQRGVQQQRTIGFLRGKVPGKYCIF